ncbi:MAG: hypothetical protein ACOY5B_08225 [Spirochaetota bacterium]
MRKAAFTTLFFLGSLNAASLSSLHVDQPQSHAVQCEPASARPDCHADLPHEHDATHAGEESLFEHIFQVSREAPAMGLASCLGPVLFRQAFDVAPSSTISFSLPAVVQPEEFRPAVRPADSRAPPVSSRV